MNKKHALVKVLDGGFSTQLSKYDAGFQDHPLWSSLILYKNPRSVYQTHLDFLKAGADVISTCTYQASIPGFKKYLDKNLSDEECVKLIENAVALAKEARDEYLKENCKEILIAGSIGPFGAFLHDYSEYTGSYIDKYAPEEIKNWHKTRIDILVKSGVDLLAFETIPVGKEAEILLELLKEYPSARAWMSFSCRDGKTISSGENFQTVARKCLDLNRKQMVAVGVNCTKPEYVEELFKDFNKGREDNPMDLIAYPNSGENYNQKDGWTGIDQCKPLHFYVKKWIEIGVTYIGGCCRTDDEIIKQIREEVDNTNGNN